MNKAVSVRLAVAVQIGAERIGDLDRDGVPDWRYGIDNVPADAGADSDQRSLPLKRDRTLNVPSIV